MTLSATLSLSRLATWGDSQRKAKVAGGEHATESEVIREGLRALFARDRAIEHWLQTDVAAAFDELQANPSKVLTIEQVRESLTKARLQQAVARG